MAKINRRPSRKKAYLKRISLKTLWRNSLNFAKHKKRFTGLLAITLILIVFIITVSLLPSEQPFEGRLKLTNLSFTSQQNQIFLNSTGSIQQLSVQNPLPLTLSGQFNDPKLKQLKNQKIQLQPLPNVTQPFWQLTSQGTIDIEKMELTRDSKINNLYYDSYNKRLSLEIIPKQPLTLIVNPSDSLTLNFTGYKIPQLPNTKSLTWQPNDQLILKITNPIKLSLKFPQTPTTSLFRGQLAVKNITFNEFVINPQDFSQNYQTSAIVGGVIRLANQNHTLSDGQFLTFNPPDSIRNLFHLQLTSQTSSTLTTNNNQTLSIDPPFEGLKVDISGIAKQIKIGINPNLPIATFQASLLEKWLPRDAVIGLIAFLSSLVATLISWMWELLTDEEE